jgi:hypothetical protein
MGNWDGSVNPESAEFRGRTPPRLVDGALHCLQAQQKKVAHRTECPTARATMHVSKRPTKARRDHTAANVKGARSATRQLPWLSGIHILQTKFPLHQATMKASTVGLEPSGRHGAPVFSCAITSSSSGAQTKRGPGTCEAKSSMDAFVSSTCSNDAISKRSKGIGVKNVEHHRLASAKPIISVPANRT